MKNTQEEKGLPDEGTLAEVLKEHTSIQVTRRTHSRLQLLGRKGESFEKIIARLLNEEEARGK